MMRVRSFALAFLLTLAALPPASVPCFAEVGVGMSQRGDEDQISGVYILSSITEDPDPTSAIWARYNPESGSRYVLNDQGDVNGDGKPSSVLNPVSGLPIVAWARNDATGFDIVLSTFAGGAWTTPVVLAGSTDDELDPFLLVDPTDGTVHLLYWVDNASPRVMHREAPADLTSWSAPVQVSDPGEIAARPAAALHLGDLRVVYEAHTLGPGGTPRQIILAIRSGGSFTSELLATTGFEGENWPQVHCGSDRVWVEWIDADGEMSWTRQIAAGSWSAFEVETFSGLEQREFHVRGTIKGHALE